MNDAPRGPGRPPKPKTVPVKLLYACWCGPDGARVPKGEVVDLDIELAKALMAEGKAERADPLPGE
jgi:hypothetical protein